ncbi:protein involved in polysaccharide export with SLBB domain [Chitinophaga polysaccharea]|uniref:Protein involved in polysaccharide export with SLBB domain n=1 Tax=Chitinophaga polysaccharea TaxID=1293035 RepID=A0A561Q1U8_9BACT|nr:SLBB domain-containing protein [Chitinophaga polysaccharea]TWF44347.1 protein involved in polysaccharide export with SLBB domain [Chitinophaga polysaccharea]
MFRKILLVQLFLFIGYCVNAQVSSASKEQVGRMKADNLSDDQVRQLVSEMKKKNVPLSQLDNYATQKGVPASEVPKLKERIQSLGLDKELSSAEIVKEAETRTYSEAHSETTASPEKEKKTRVFGSELFNNKNLTFEPNLRLPTPVNYHLGTGDEVIIDVYGYSEVQHKLKVSPDGYINIPNLGLIYVNGLSIEDARNRITKQLSTIYSGIKSGNTFVQITLGNIRSIRVLLIGEIVNPGSYTLPSLATVANALYVSGGPSENGSFRNIQVIRNGQVISTFDLYDFLVNGDLSNSIVLQDQDIVKVNPYGTRVELYGEVKRPAIYEAKPNETLQQVISYAGGYTDNAFRETINAFRINNKEREVVTVTASQVPNFQLKSGDQFFISGVLNRFSNRVIIAGQVFHAGTFALEPNMTLSDLIKKADGVTENASLTRGIIRRLQKDYSPSFVSFNVQDVIDGKEQVFLRKEDSVVIYGKTELREAYHVKILGEVNNPGVYAYGDSMRLEDLILLAGGLRDAASLSNIEVSRIIREPGYNSKDSLKSIIQKFNLNSEDNATHLFSLQPFDEVMIRRAPLYSSLSNVVIEGEVVYPGTYTINSKKEHISDLVKRGGGLRPDAFPEGAVLLRRTFVTGSDSSLLANKLETFFNKLQDSSSIEHVKTSIERKQQLLGISLDKIMRSPGSKYDLYLEEGDVISVPKKLQTVQMFGEIYFPKKIRYDGKYTFRDYINGSGGFTAQALRRRSYIVYANGEVKNTSKILFFNRYPKVKPGAEIYVPSRREHKGLSGNEAIGLASGLASVALVIVTILNAVK